MNKRQKTREQGAVALITAMIVSILLMITTAGMVSLTVKSLRQSTDGAQSTKAYYAAEGGLEEALLKLRTDPNYKGNCLTGASSANSAKTGVVTCTVINESPNELIGTVGENQSVQLDLSAVTNLSSIKVEWGVDSYVSSSIPDYLPTGKGSEFPKKVDWPSTAPAVMELGVIEYPSSNFKLDDVLFRQGLLTPKSSVEGERSWHIPAFPFYNNIDPNPNSPSNTPDLSRPLPVACDKNLTYQCAVGVKIAAGKRYVLRLKTRYNGAKYRIIAQDSNNKPITIPGAMYTVDVTARAGDTFRRVQTSFPAGGTVTSVPPLSGLDYVLYSDTDICKNFEAKSFAVGFGCPAP